MPAEPMGGGAGGIPAESFDEAFTHKLGGTTRQVTIDVFVNYHGTTVYTPDEDHFADQVERALQRLRQRRSA